MFSSSVGQAHVAGTQRSDRSEFTDLFGASVRSLCDPSWHARSVWTTQVHRLHRESTACAQVFFTRRFDDARVGDVREVDPLSETSTADGLPRVTGEVAVLVVEDDPGMQEVLVMAFRHAGYRVTPAASGQEAVEAVRTRRHDLAIFDVMLPDTDGFSLLRDFQRAGVVIPTIFLTARDAVEDRVDGLEAGGADYVCKPFSLLELLVRANAVLRRSRASDAREDDDRLGHADLVLDEGLHQVWRSGRAIELSTTEFALLRYLLMNAEQVLTRRQILDRVWDGAYDERSNVVDRHVHSLRKKIGDQEASLIQTVRGMGYAIRRPLT